MQKGKHSVIDIDTSEPSDIQSVATESSGDEKEGLSIFGYAKIAKKRMNNTLKYMNIHRYEEEHDEELRSMKIDIHSIAVNKVNDLMKQ